METIPSPLFVSQCNEITRIPRRVWGESAGGFQYCGNRVKTGGFYCGKHQPNKQEADDMVQAHPTRFRFELVLSGQVESLEDYRQLIVDIRKLGISTTTNPQVRIHSLPENSRRREC